MNLPPHQALRFSSKTRGNGDEAQATMQLTMQQAERYGEEWHHVSGTVASHANVPLTRHTIFPNVRGAGTRDEPLRTPACEARVRRCYPENIY